MCASARNVIIPTPPHPTPNVKIPGQPPRQTQHVVLFASGHYFLDQWHRCWLFYYGVPSNVFSSIEFACIKVTQRLGIEVMVEWLGWRSSDINRSELRSKTLTGRMDSGVKWEGKKSQPEFPTSNHQKLYSMLIMQKTSGTTTGSISLVFFSVWLKVEIYIFFRDVILNNHVLSPGWSFNFEMSHRLDSDLKPSSGWFQSMCVIPRHGRMMGCFFDVFPNIGTFYRSFSSLDQLCKIWKKVRILGPACLVTHLFHVFAFGCWLLVGPFYIYIYIYIHIYTVNLNILDMLWYVGCLSRHVLL